MKRLAPYFEVLQIGSRKRTELIVFASLALFHLGYVFFVSTPLIHADEAGELLKAAALVGHKTHGPTAYGVGFPILISPLFMIFGDPETIFRFVLLVNAMLAILTAWLVYRFLIIWKGDGQNWHAALLASGAAALYPASFVYTTSAQAEVLFSTMFAGLLLSHFRFAKSDGQDSWQLVLSAVLTGAIVVVHVRGAPTAILSAFFVMYILSRSRRFGALAAWFAIAAGILSTGRWIAQIIDGRLTLDSLSDISRFSSSSYHVMSKFHMFSSYEDLVAGLRWLLVTGLGQLSYLVAATFGLLVIGALAVARRARVSVSISTQVFHIFVLMLLAANLAMSAFSLSLGTRIDHLFYGRYNEAVLPIYLAIGLLEINRASMRISLVAFLASVITSVSILATIPDGDFSQANLHNVTSFFWLIVPFESFGASGLILLGCISATMYIAVYFLYVSFYRRLPIILLVCVIFAVQSVLLGALFLKPSSEGRIAQRRIAEYIQAHIKPGTCITQHLTAETSLWAHWNTKFFLLNYPIREEARIEPDQICGQWVISADPDFETGHPNARMVLREYNHAQRLWYVGQDPESVRFAY